MESTRTGTSSGSTRRVIRAAVEPSWPHITAAQSGVVPSVPGLSTSAGDMEGWADEPLPGRLKAFLYLDPTTRDGGALRVRSPRFPLPPAEVRLGPEGHRLMRVCHEGEA